MTGEIGCCQQLESANVPDPDIWAKTLSGIGSGNIDQTYDLDSKTTYAHGVGLKPDGSILFAGSMNGTFNDYVIEYPLSTDFDLSTASVSSTASDHLSIGSYETLLGGFDFADDGSKLFTFGRTVVDRWDLSTAYDLSTGSHVTNTLSVSSQTTTMYDGYVRNDGLKLYVVGYQPDKVEEYDLSTAYDLGTASHNQSFDISAKSIVTSGIHFSTNGYAFVVYDNSGGDCHKYNLSTAWDISTATFHSSSGGFGLSTGGGIWFDDDWSYLYIIEETDDEVNRIVLAAIPGVPTSLAIASASTSQLNLSWSSGGDTDSYQISRSTSSGSGFSQIATGVTATSYNNTGLSAGTRYYYKIRAVNTEGNSAYTSEVSRFTLPNQVSGLSASAVSNTQINLSWNNPTGTEAGYKIERSTSSGSGYSQIATTTSTSYSATGLTLNTTYYFRVRAYTDPGGDGAYSSVANATTQNNASAPTGVSIATSSSGNYNNAVTVENVNVGSGGQQPVALENGSGFSSNTATIALSYSPDYEAAMNNNSGVLELQVRGYIRATNATSFAWETKNLSIDQDTHSSLSSITTTGSNSTDQDETGSGGDIGKRVRMIHNSGGRGYLMLSVSGDGISYDVLADATNSGGSTQASTLTIEIQV
jgi:fibronectin type 3 domain-containing protein